MIYRTPIFVQAGMGKNAQGIGDLLSRWNLYGQILQRQTNNMVQKLIVFMPLPKEEVFLDQYKNLEINFFRDSALGRFTLFFKIFRRIKSLPKNFATLIAGDNYFSPIICWSVKFLFPSSTRVQIQFHGAIYQKDSKGGFLSFLKHFFVRFSIFCSDSIRIVSNFQQYDIEKFKGTRNKDFVVSPIPISLAKLPSERISHTGLTVLVLGRLHSERGIDKLIDLIGLLNAKNIDCTFYVVGDGPLKNLLEPYSKDLNNPTKVELHGWKNESEVNSFLAQSDLLVSFAEDEGYGLSIREALLSGVHVLARRNRGTLETLTSFPGQIDLFDNPPQALMFIKSFKPIQLGEGELRKIRIAQELRDRGSLEKLIDSWVRN